ncbi:Poly(A)+ RNA export protein rae1, partial [Perkinsus olseni]
MYNLQAQRDQQIGQHDAPVKKVVWVEEMKMCISGSWDKSLRLWSPGQPNPVATLQLPERLYAMDCNFPLLVCATADRHV